MKNHPVKSAVRAIEEWFNHDAEEWQFWYPQSPWFWIIGIFSVGFICGALVF